MTKGKNCQQGEGGGGDERQKTKTPQPGERQIPYWWERAGLLQGISQSKAHPGKAGQEKEATNDKDEDS